MKNTLFYLLIFISVSINQSSLAQTADKPLNSITYRVDGRVNQKETERFQFIYKSDFLEENAEIKEILYWTKVNSKKKKLKIVSQKSVYDGGLAISEGEFLFPNTNEKAHFRAELMSLNLLVGQQELIFMNEGSIQWADDSSDEPAAKEGFEFSDDEFDLWYDDWDWDWDYENDWDEMSIE